MFSPRTVIQELASAMQLFSEEAVQFARLIVEVALSAAVLLHALKWAVRILLDH